MFTVLYTFLLFIVLLVVFYVGYKIQFSTRWFLYVIYSILLTLNLLYVNESINIFEILVNSTFSFSLLFILFILIDKLLLFKIIDTILCVVLTIPLILKYKFNLSYFSHDCFVSFFQTNLEEALNMLLGGFSYEYICIFICLFFIFYWDKLRVKLPAKLKMIFSLIFVVIGIFSYSYSSSMFYIGKYKMEYHRKMKYLSRNRNVNYSEFKMNKIDSLTCVLVIGESLCRDYLSGYGYKVKTTPHLDSLLNDSSIIKLSNSYSSDIVTINCVPRILSSESQLMDNMDYTLPNLLKEKGFKVFWLSNQNQGGFEDNPVSVLADRADITHFRHGNDYDEKLIPLFQQAISDEFPLKLIILHLIGSHAPAKSYYPQIPQYCRNIKIDNDVLYHYENSIIYNDEIMNTLYNKISSKKKTLFFYTSDHGEKPGIPRLPEQFDFQMCRVPFFIYFSPDLRCNHVYNVIQQNKEKFWFNDLTFNLICGILNISHNEILKKQWDLSSSEYSLDKNDLKVTPNFYSVKDDIYNFSNNNICQ